MRTALMLVFFLGLSAFRPMSYADGQELSQKAPVRDGTPNGEPEASSGYVLGPDDQITIQVPDVEEISARPVQIDTTGFVTLALVGRVRAAGLTIPQLEAELTQRLSRYVTRPQVAVTVTEFRSQPVSVMGAVNTPGVHQVRGRKNLAEVLSMSGGLRQDAGRVVTITRRAAYGTIPLATAKADPTGEYSVAEVDVRAILRAEHPEENLLIKPHDVITVLRAEMVYVIGEVRNSGGYLLNEREDLSVLKALSLAGGILRSAAPNRARVLCATAKPSAGRVEIPVDVGKILQGKAPDFPLHAEDILFVPTNTSKNVAVRVIEAAVQTASGVVVWRSARY